MDTTNKSNMTSKIVIGIIILSVTLGFSLLLKQELGKRQNLNSNATGNSAEQLRQGLPDVPSYPGAQLEEFSKRDVPLNTGHDVYAKWVSTEPPIKIMEWYIVELQKNGWEIVPPDDANSASMQVAYLSKGSLKGNITVEHEKGDEIEITVDLSNSGN